MRFFAVHDTAGNISWIVGCPPEAPLTLPAKLEPGQSVTEIDLPDGATYAADRDVLQGLLEVAQNFRLEVVAGRPAQLLQLDSNQQPFD